MNAIFTQAITIEGPSVSLWSIALGVALSIIGLIAFRHGRKKDLPIPMWAGATMVVFPYFIYDVFMMAVIGWGLMFLVYWYWE